MCSLYSTRKNKVAVLQHQSLVDWLSWSSAFDIDYSFSSLIVPLFADKRGKTKFFREKWVLKEEKRSEASDAEPFYKLGSVLGSVGVERPKFEGKKKYKNLKD
jgi:hypothetical protein